MKIINSFNVFFMCVLMLFTVGCSDQTIKRTTYDTLQNIRDKECSRTPSVNCDKRESLEVYEDKRQQVQL